MGRGSFTATEVDGEYMNAICVNHNKVFISGRWKMTGFIGTVTELNAYAERLIHSTLKKGTIPKLGTIRSNTTLQTLHLPLIDAKDPTSVQTLHMGLYLQQSRWQYEGSVSAESNKRPWLWRCKVASRYCSQYVSLHVSCGSSWYIVYLAGSNWCHHAYWVQLLMIGLNLHSNISWAILQSIFTEISVRIIVVFRGI